MINSILFDRILSSVIFVDIDEDLLTHILSTFREQFASVTTCPMFEFLDPDYRRDPGIYIIRFRNPELEMIKEVHKILSANTDTRVICTAHTSSASFVASAFRSGVSDFILDTPDPRYLMRAIQAVDVELVSATERAKLATDARAKLGSLTPRERRVLDGLIAGQQNKAIAADLDLSVRTVEMFRATMMQKLGMKSVADAIRLSMTAENELDRGRFNKRHSM
jgi:two-component system response regulator FixJ